MAECTYAAIYAMRDPKGKTVADMFPQIFEDDNEEENQDRLSDDEINELQDLMKNYNMAKGNFN